MDLYTMQYAVAVAEYLNFSAAAQHCGVGQSALSQQISKLEKELGTTLFLRNSKGVVLTEAGEAFVLRAREILQLSQALQSEMALYAGLRKGSLKLGIITSLQCIDFGNMLSAFCGTYPDISVNITQGGTYRLAKLLADRKIDMAFMNRPISKSDSALEFLRLGQDRYALAVPARHPLAKRSSVSLKELARERFIFHQPDQVASELCLAACQRAGFQPNIVCQSSDPTVGLHMVRGGLGLALLPEEEFRFRTLLGVVEVRIQEPIIKEVGAAWRRDTASPIVKAALQFAQEWTR